MKNYSSSTSPCRIDDARVSIRRLFLIITDTARRVVSYVTLVDNYVNEVKVFERCTLPRLWAVSATNLQLRAWFCIGQTTQHSRYVQDAEDLPKNTIYWVFTGAPTTSGPTDNKPSPTTQSHVQRHPLPDACYPIVITLYSRPLSYYTYSPLAHKISWWYTACGKPHFTGMLILVADQLPFLPAFA